MQRITIYIWFVLLGCVAWQPLYGLTPVDTLTILKKKIIPLGRMDREIFSQTIVPRKQVAVGLSASYSSFINDDYELLKVLTDFDATGYVMSIKPYVGYFFRDNLMAGVRLEYSRTFLRLDNVSIDLGEEMNFSFSDLYLLEHKYSGTGFVRSYVSLGSSRRFALFNETNITFSGGNAKFMTGKGDNLIGTYSLVRELQIGVAPGLTAFIANNVGVEVSFGVAGFHYRKETAMTDQVVSGTRESSGANFKIDLLKISIGLSIYL